MEPLKIKKDKLVPSSQDYKYLRTKGLEHIQELAGNTWTDYNLHDPGITILEELCYALTDLSYRSGLDVKDLLTEKWGAKIAPETNALFTPGAVMTSNPVTLSDYRKLLLDRLTTIENIWLYPQQLPENVSGYSGLYRVSVQPGEWFRTTAQLGRSFLFLGLGLRPEIANAQLRKQILNELHANRNLCEDYLPVRILQELKVHLHGDVHISHDYDPEAVLGEIIFAVREYFSGKIPTHSLQDLLDKGHAVEDIFVGPKLSNGYILDQDLSDKIKVLSISKINKLIMEVQGVESVKNLKWGGDRSAEDIVVDENSYPVLVNHGRSGDETFTIKVWKNNYEYDDIKKDLVDKKLDELDAEAARVYRLQSASADDLEIPKGEFRDVSTYDSIQNHFPRTYRLHKNSLARSAPNATKARAKQLKGYLLFFEQFLANYFAQLHHIGDLFSVEKGRTHEQSYFSQTLENVPDVEPLLKNFKKGSLSSNGRDEHGLFRNGKHMPVHYGPDFLDAIAETKYERQDRKNRMLDHLLARFGEQIPELSASSFNRHYKRALNHDYLSTSIEIKSKILRHYEQLSQMRSRAADYSRDIWKIWAEYKQIAIDYLNEKAERVEEQVFPERNRTAFEQYNYSVYEVWKEIEHFPNIYGKYQHRIDFEDRFDVSGLERKVAMLLHIRHDFKRKLVEEVKNPLLELPSKDELAVSDDQKKKKIERKAVWLEEELTIEMDEWLVEDVIDEDMKKGRFTFEINSRNGLPDILKHGIIKDNYRIGLIKETYGDSNWFTLFKRPEDETWKIIGKHDHRTEANDMLQKTIRILVDVSIRSEGFHLIEHTLFRYLIDDAVAGPIDPNRFGFVLLDPDKKGFLSQESLTTFSERERTIADVLKYGQDMENYQRRESKEKPGKFQFVLHRSVDSASSQSAIAVSQEFYSLVDSSQKDDENRRKLANYVTLIAEDPKRYFPQLKHTVRTMGKDLGRPGSMKAKHVDENFFNFQATVVLPDWPARFQYPDFKKHLETVVKENSPAHIKMNFIWLNYFEMEAFESLYMEWCRAKLKYIEVQTLDAFADQQQAISNFIELTDQMIDFLRIQIYKA